MCAITFFNYIVNMLVLIYNSVKETINECHKKKHAKEVLKQLDERRDKQAA